MRDIGRLVSGDDVVPYAHLSLSVRAISSASALFSHSLSLSSSKELLEMRDLLFCFGFGFSFLRDVEEQRRY